MIERITFRICEILTRCFNYTSDVLYRQKVIFYFATSKNISLVNDASALTCMCDLDLDPEQHLNKFKLISSKIMVISLVLKCRRPWIPRSSIPNYSNASIPWYNEIWRECLSMRRVIKRELQVTVPKNTNYKFRLQATVQWGHKLWIPGVGLQAITNTSYKSWLQATVHYDTSYKSRLQATSRNLDCFIDRTSLSIRYPYYLLIIVH